MHLVDFYGSFNSFLFSFVYPPTLIDQLVANKIHAKAQYIA